MTKQTRDGICCPRPRDRKPAKRARNVHERIERGQFYYLYVVSGVYSRKVVAWQVHLSEDSEHAAALIRQACLDEGVEPKQLVLHSDNGAPMKSITLFAMLEVLGVTPS